MLVIPNATDTTGGNKYEALDQAEPDSLDFEILGNIGRSGVLSGAAVTTNSSAANVLVAAGVVVLNGIPYNVTAQTLGLPTAPADDRFDMVVARVTGGLPALAVISGDNSATNPSFPKTASTIAGAYDSAVNIDLETDVVLAAVFRSGSGTVTSTRIVDKRAQLALSVFNQGTADPLSTAGIGAGALYYKTTAPNGSESGVFVKTSSGPWIELAQNVGPHLPIGAVVAWPSKVSVPDGCLELNGQALAAATYPSLFDVYAYDHAPTPTTTGGTFWLPDWNNKYLRGTTTPSVVATTTGSDTTTLTTAQLPAHYHSMAHTHTYTHSHGLETSGNPLFPTPAVTEWDEHSHTVDPPATYLSTMNFGGKNWYAAYQSNGGIATVGVASTGIETQTPIAASFAWAGLTTGTTQPSVNIAAFTSGSDNHRHTYTLIPQSGSTTSQSASTTGPVSTANTGNTGSGNTIDNKPASAYTRWIVRATMGSDSGAAGSPSPYEHLFSNSVEIENPVVGDTYLWVAAFDCAVTRVRAWRLDGSGMTVNVKIGSTPLYALSTDLTTPGADTWSSSTSAQAIAAGELVEVEVVSVTGAPTLGIVQVDFES